jgi:hypothetical protein
MFLHVAAGYEIISQVCDHEGKRAKDTIHDSLKNLAAFFRPWHVRRSVFKNQRV